MTSCLMPDKSLTPTAAPLSGFVRLPFQAAGSSRRDNRIMKMSTGPIALALILAPWVAFTQSSLTYQIEGGWAGTSSSVSFAGTFSYDTSAEDQLIQSNAGRFGLTSWNVLVDVNRGEQVTLFTSAEAGQGLVRASLTQGVNPPILIFQNEDHAEFGVNLGFEGGDPNVPWYFPDGTLLTFGFVEGGFPDDINDHHTTLNLGSRITLIPEPNGAGLLSLGAAALLILLGIRRSRRCGAVQGHSESPVGPGPV